TMTPKEQCELLMNAILPFAKRMLGEFGGFNPFGGYLTPEGEVVHVGAVDEEEPEFPKATDLLAIMRENFREMAAKGECKAVAIVFDIVTTLPGSTRKSDAIQVSLEHVDNLSAEVVFPYSIADGQPSLKMPFAYEGEYNI